MGLFAAALAIVMYLIGVAAGTRWCRRLHVDEDRCGRCRCGANPTLYTERGAD